MRSILLLFLVLIFTSCGDDTAPPEEFVPREEIPERCLGCTQDTQCLEGDKDGACGVNGDACVACEDGESCQNGSCVSPETCAETCNGCCDDDGMCLSGDEDSACGSGGEMCAGCAEGSCVDNACETIPCDVDTCTGCCDAAGVCQTGDLDDACGTGAIACNDCTAVQNVCLGGVCMVDANACSQTCAGCCDGETCIEPVSDAQCGIGGSACVACGGGDVCAGGACGVPMMADRYDIFIVSSEVAFTKPDGRSWDTFDAEPDLFIVAGAFDIDDTVYYDQTTGRRSEFSTVWNINLAMDAPLSAVNNRLQIEIWDGDTLSDDDIVCVFNPPVDPNVLAGVEQTSICAEDSDTSIRWRLVPKP